MSFGATFDKRLKVGDQAVYYRRRLGSVNPPAPQASSPFPVEIVELREQGYIVKERKPGFYFEGTPFCADADEVS